MFTLFYVSRRRASALSALLASVALAATGTSSTPPSAKPNSPRWATTRPSRCSTPPTPLSRRCSAGRSS